MIRSLVLVSLFAAGCSSEAPAASMGVRELPVLGGTVDTTHEAVVSIVTPMGDPRPELCTGTIVAPRLVLTAGHCTIGRSPTGLVVGVGGDSASPSRTLAIAEIHTPSRYTLAHADDERGFDIGVIVLAEDAGIAPIPVAASSVDGPLSVVGFGQRTDSAETRGTRAIATVTAHARCSTLIEFGDAVTNACHGDSGGPLLGKRADGSEVVVGIVSYGSSPSGTCDPPTYAVRADAYSTWISKPDDACGSCPSGDDCVAPVADAGADTATDASSSGNAEGGGSCSAGRAQRGHGAALLIVLALLVSRRCNDACSRSSGDRCR